LSTEKENQITSHSAFVSEQLRADFLNSKVEAKAKTSTNNEPTNANYSASGARGT